MKEIIRKVIIGVIVAVIAIGIAVKVIKGDEPDVEQTTTTASAGSVSDSTNPAAPTDSNDNVNANATTNNSGNVQQSTTNGSAVQNTTGSQAVAPSQSTPVQSATQNSGVQQPSTQASQPVQTQPNQPGVTTQTTTGSTFNPQPVQPQQPTNKIDVYQQIFASGKFIMKVNDPDLGPVTMAMNGNKMYIDASMDGVSLKMLYDGDKPDEDNPSMGTWYIIVDQLKKYSPMPSDMLGDMNVEDLTKDIANGDGNTVYTKSTETLNGETVNVESCVDSNGNTTKYYFRGDQLIRSDSISPSGEVSTTEFQEISANVDDRLFEIPVGYAKLDISWLFSMMA